METKNGLGLTTEETIALASGIQPGPRMPSTKSITAATTALTGYPLEAPAKKLYFIEDAMRRRVPRKVNETGGTTAHWKIITAINSGKIKASVAEGAVNTALTLATAPISVDYKTLNMYQTYTDEARIMGRKFEDIPALGMLATLQALMIQEDRYTIGGNITTLNTAMAANTIVPADSATAGSLTGSGNNYDFGVSALTLQGYLNAATGRTGGVDSPDETQIKAVTNYSLGAVTSVDLTWTDVPGAFAYNVYIGAHGGTYYYSQTVTVNAAHVAVSPGAGHTNNTADQTADALGFDGILAQAVAGSCQYTSMNNAVLNSDGAGGVAEIETKLQQIWNTYRISPTVMLINAQEAKTIKKLTIGSSSSNAVRITINESEKNKFTAGSAVNTYYSPYTEQLINIVTSVHMPPGKILMLPETIPYPNSEVPNNFEIELQQEYYGEMFARTTRSTPVGVTMIGALKCYLPGAIGVIANIKAS